MPRQKCPVRAVTDINDKLAMTRTHIPPKQLNALWRRWRRGWRTEQNSRQSQFYTFYHEALQKGAQLENRSVAAVLLTFSSMKEGPCTNNNTEESWHSKLRNLAGKTHPNTYKAVTLFQSEQAVTKFSLMQLAAGGLPKRRRRKYRNHEKTYYY